MSDHPFTGEEPCRGINNIFFGETVDDALASDNGSGDSPLLVKHPELVRLEEFRRQKAKAICGECAIREECLSYALMHRVEGGVWGGMDEGERAQILYDREIENSKMIHPSRAVFPDEQPGTLRLIPGAKN